MQRVLDGLTGHRFDLLVIGGGIHGLFAAYDAAQRGLSVALVEGADFGSGLSFNHQRTIHGGLRALQHGNLRKTRQQTGERRTWARIAPHLIRPLPFLLGTYGRGRRSRLALRAGFRVYDAVGRARNAGVTAELHIPNTRLESMAATRRLFPGIDERGLTGGGLWYDYQTRHPDRLTWTVALAAEQAGARLVNYAQAVGALEAAGGRVTGARVRDVLSGREVNVEASVTLLAVGSALSAVIPLFGATGAPPLVRAMNVLLDRPARDIALAAAGASGRMLTAVPWRGYVLVGTDQSPDIVAAPEPRPPASALEAFLSDINVAFPRLAATRSDVRIIHHGLTPAVADRGRIDLMPEPLVIRHQAQGRAGLLSLVGVKYTTARRAAEEAVDAVIGEIGTRSGRPCRTSSTILPHANIADAEGLLIETARGLQVNLDRETLDHLAGWYGTEAPAVVRYASKTGLLDRLSEAAAVMTGEVAYAVEFASAVRLSDAVLRRLPLGSAGHPGHTALQRAADIMGAKLDWTATRRLDEIALVDGVY